MRVVEIKTQDGQSRYVVIDEDGVLVEPIVRYLKYLDCIGSARQTLRSYAYSLKHYWEYLIQQHLNWQQVTLDDLSRFVLWLKLPSGSLKVLPAHPVPQARSNRTINHALTVVRSFYDYHWTLLASKVIASFSKLYAQLHVRDSIRSHKQLKAEQAGEQML